MGRHTAVPLPKSKVVAGVRGRISGLMADRGPVRRVVSAMFVLRKRLQTRVRGADKSIRMIGHDRAGSPRAERVARGRTIKVWQSRIRFYRAFGTGPFPGARGRTTKHGEMQDSWELFSSQSASR
jgi:hypothetical protein